MKMPKEATIQVLNIKALNETEYKLKIALTEGSLVKLSMGLPIYALVDPKDEMTAEIRPFLDPLKVNDVWVIDLRMVHTRVSVNGNIATTQPASPAELLFKLTLASMSWDKNPTDLQEVGHFPMIVFSKWLSQLIGDSLGLKPLDKDKVEIVCAAWFYCQKNHPGLSSGDTLDSDDLQLMINAIKNTSVLEHGLITQTVTDCNYISDVLQFVEKLKGLYINKLSNINMRVIFTLIANSWFGLPDAKHFIAIAIEYPPYFMTIIHEALNNRNYKNTSISKNVERLSRHSSLRMFKASMDRIITSNME